MSINNNNGYIQNLAKRKHDMEFYEADDHGHHEAEHVCLLHICRY